MASMLSRSMPCLLTVAFFRALIQRYTPMTNVKVSKSKYTVLSARVSVGRLCVVFSMLSVLSRFQVDLSLRESRHSATDSAHTLPKQHRCHKTARTASNGRHRQPNVYRKCLSCVKTSHSLARDLTRHSSFSGPTIIG